MGDWSASTPAAVIFSQQPAASAGPAHVFMLQALVIFLSATEFGGQVQCLSAQLLHIEAFSIAPCDVLSCCLQFNWFGTSAELPDIAHVKLCFASAKCNHCICVSSCSCIHCGGWRGVGRGEHLHMTSCPQNALLLSCPCKHECRIDHAAAALATLFAHLQVHYKASCMADRNRMRHTCYLACICASTGAKSVPHACRFMASQPDKWDYAAAGIPSPLTDELESQQSAKQVSLSLLGTFQLRICQTLC